MLAGEKKCRPTTSCGRFVCAAISFTSRVEVLVAMMAPGLAILSSLAKISFFSAMFSNTASMMRSALPSSSIFNAGVSLANRSPACAAVMRPRLALASSVSLMRATPLSRASWVVSTMVTGKPALRKARPMPVPMVPAPRMPTVLMSRSLVSGPMPGRLAAWRSAKNLYCSARA